MYRSIRLDECVHVIKEEKNSSSSEICAIPRYYQNDMVIGEVIAKLLNEGKIKINLVI